MSFLATMIAAGIGVALYGSGVGWIAWGAYIALVPILLYVAGHYENSHDDYHRRLPSPPTSGESSEGKQ